MQAWQADWPRLWAQRWQKMWEAARPCVAAVAGEGVAAEAAKRLARVGVLRAMDCGPKRRRRDDDESEQPVQRLRLAGPRA